jgi:hypothetical protein
MDNNSQEVVEQEVVEQEVTEQDVTEKVETEEQNDRVPLNKFLEEKKKRKELERKMREFESKEQDQKEKDALEKIRNIAKEKDFDEDTADMFATLFKETMAFQPKKSDPLTQQINEDIAEIAELNPDISKYKTEISEKVKKFAKVGEELTVEEAYRLVAPQSLKLNEMQTDLEQKNALKRRESYENKQLNSSSKELTSKIKLDEVDRKALAGLQKYQPEAGWNEEKYFKTMKG